MRITIEAHTVAEQTPPEGVPLLLWSAKRGRWGEEMARYRAWCSECGCSCWSASKGVQHYVVEPSDVWAALPDEGPAA